MYSPHPFIERVLPFRNFRTSSLDLAFKSNSSHCVRKDNQLKRRIRSFLAILLVCGSAMVALISGTDVASAQNSTIFGPNVCVFTPSDSNSSINTTLATLAGNAQFSTNRYAVFFEPGTYSGVESQVGYYMSVAGLGKEPTAAANSSGDLAIAFTDSTANQPLVMGIR